jgi:hypothetical protein
MRLGRRPVNERGGYIIDDREQTSRRELGMENRMVR